MSSDGSSKEGIVGFRLPGETPVWWQGPVVQDSSADGFFIAPFDGETPWVLTPTHQLESAPSHWPTLANNPGLAEDDQESYQLKIKQALDQITSGNLDKVVLSRSQTYGFAPHPIDFFRALEVAYPTAFVYLLWTPQHGCWAGATPETLLAYSHGGYHTQALAGTMPYPSGRDWTDKEYREQQLVTDTIVGGMQKAGFDPLVGERETTVAGTVQHLSTPIQVEAPFEKASLLELATALHPTPAVCGLPRAKALSAIHTIERRDRQLYTGYLGPVVAKSTAQLFVNLRCCQLWQDTVTLHVGGGIVEGSEPEAEWEETENKAQTLLSVLQKIARP